MSYREARISLIVILAAVLGAGAAAHAATVYVANHGVLLREKGKGENSANVRVGAFCKPSRKKALHRAYLLFQAPHDTTRLRNSTRRRRSGSRRRAARRA